MDNLIFESINVVFSSQNLLAILAATFIGIVFGAIPGLGAIVGMALLMPFSYHWPSVTALIFMAVFYNADVYGGSFAAILRDKEEWRSARQQWLLSAGAVWD